METKQATYMHKTKIKTQVEFGVYLSQNGAKLTMLSIFF